MKKPAVFVAALSLLLLSPCRSFALSRQDAMEEALKKLEKASSPAPQEKPFQAAALKETPVQQKPKAPAPKSAPVKENITYGKEAVMESSFSISAGPELDHPNYREFDKKDTLDRDYGTMGGFYAVMSYTPHIYVMSGLVNSKLLIEGYYRKSSGHLTYDGRTTAGTPVKFKQRSSIERFGIKLGIGNTIPALNRGEYFIYFDGGARIWHRGQNRLVGNAVEYAEKYSWPNAGIGCRASCHLTPRFVPGVEIEYLAAIRPKMRADLDEGGTFDLRSVHTGEARLPLKYYLFKNLSFDLTPYYTYVSIKKSKAVTISGSSYIEPSSVTHIFSLEAGLTYDF